MILTKHAVLDGQLTFERGVDTYRAPSRVPRNQCCLLVNNTTRQDYIGTRPGWNQIGLNFVKYQNGSYVPDAALKTAFEDGYFQGFNGYRPDQGSSHLVFSISGKIFRVNPFTGSVQALTLPDLSPGVPDPNPTRRPLVWYVQGECFLVIQDGQSKPIIYDGALIRRSDTLGKGGSDANGKPLLEVPVGTCMAYSGGRLWVAIDDGQHFVGGDGVYGPTGTAGYNRRDAILRFTENQYLSGGFPFAVPANMGPIRAMIALANLDTSLGQGPLQVFTIAGCFSVDAPFDRTAWYTVTYPIKTVSLLDAGALSQRACQLVNGDAWYRSLDGARSFMIARRDFGTWGNRSMSYEVIRHLKDDNRNLLDRSSAALLDNRLLMTCDPQSDQKHGIYHRGFVVLDFIPLTSLAGSEPPCWDGLWTGPKVVKESVWYDRDVLQIQTVQSEGVDHLYAAILAEPDNNGDRKIQLWELTLNAGRDTSIDLGPQRIPRVIEGPKLDFQNKLEQKMLEGCEIWMDKVSGMVDMTLLFRPDEHPCWFTWKTWTVCAKTERCASDAVDGCMPNLNLKEQYRARVGALRPPDAVVPGTGNPSRLGFTFQTRLEIVGDVEITAIRLLAKRLVEASFGAPADATCEEVFCCDPSGSVSSTVPGCCDGGGGTIPPSAGGGTIPPTTPPSGGGGGGGNPPTEPALPSWPTDGILQCGVQTQQFGPIEVSDPINGTIATVAINPGMADPNAYMAFFGQPGATQAWADAVWANFIASGIPFSAARFIWASVNVTGFGFMGIQVFPGEPGGYQPVNSLNTSICIEYCPA